VYATSATRLAQTGPVQLRPSHVSDVSVARILRSASRRASEDPMDQELRPVFLRGQTKRPPSPDHSRPPRRRRRARMRNTRTELRSLRQTVARSSTAPRRRAERVRLATSSTLLESSRLGTRSKRATISSQGWIQSKEACSRGRCRHRTHRAREHDRRYDLRALLLRYPRHRRVSRARLAHIGSPELTLVEFGINACDGGGPQRPIWEGGRGGPSRFADRLRLERSCTPLSSARRRKTPAMP